MAEHCYVTQLIDGNGEFSVAGLEDFTKKVKLAEYGLNYAVVAIMGPQSSGILSFASFLAIYYNSFDLAELMRNCRN